MSLRGSGGGGEMGGKRKGSWWGVGGRGKAGGRKRGTGVPRYKCLHEQRPIGLQDTHLSSNLICLLLTEPSPLARVCVFVYNMYFESDERCHVGKWQA